MKNLVFHIFYILLTFEYIVNQSEVRGVVFLIKILIFIVLFVIFREISVTIYSSIIPDRDTSMGLE